MRENDRKRRDELKREVKQREKQIEELKRQHDEKLRDTKREVDTDSESSSSSFEDLTCVDINEQMKIEEEIKKNSVAQKLKI